jgi:hypothetical protein
MRWLFTTLSSYYPSVLFVSFSWRWGEATGKLESDEAGGFSVGLLTETFLFPVIPYFVLITGHV